MNHLKLLDNSFIGSYGIWKLDQSKIVVSSRGSSLNGADLEQSLRENYHLQMEMCGADYVTAITTFLDDQKELERLVIAFKKIDREISETDRQELLWECKPLIKITLADAVDKPNERIPIIDCAGKISAEFIYLYPPGIPIVTPGEQITGEIIRQVTQYKQMGLPVQGMADPRAEYLQVIK